MVVVGAVGQHQVGLPLADEADDLQAVFEGGQQFAVGDVEHFVLHAEAPPGFLGFGLAAGGEALAAQGLVALVAVGERDELDGVPTDGVKQGQPARVKVTIVGVGTDDEDADGSGLGQGAQGEQQKHGEPVEGGVHGVWRFRLAGQDTGWWKIIWVGLRGMGGRVYTCGVLGGKGSRKTVFYSPFQVPRILSWLQTWNKRVIST